jgi:hypothetical protein
MAKKEKKTPDFAPQSFIVSFELFPQIAMIRENALRLAQQLASHHALTDIHMSDEAWEFKTPVPKQGEPRGLIRVKVDDEKIRLVIKSIGRVIGSDCEPGGF